MLKNILTYRQRTINGRFRNIVISIQFVIFKINYCLLFSLPRRFCTYLVTSQTKLRALGIQSIIKNLTRNVLSLISRPYVRKNNDVLESAVRACDVWGRICTAIVAYLVAQPALSVYVTPYRNGLSSKRGRQAGSRVSADARREICLLPIRVPWCHRDRASPYAWLIT